MLSKKLPEDVVEARRIIRRSKAFVIVEGELYKKSISGYYKGVSHLKKDKLYYMKSMHEYVVIMQVVEQYQPKLSGQVSIG
jgi:hypothetical protein